MVSIRLAESHSMDILLPRTRPISVTKWPTLYIVWLTWMSLISNGLSQNTAVNAMQDSIATLVSRLDSPEFAIRESAMEELSRVDEKNLAELEVALKGLKPQELEVRVRLSSIITRIKSDRTQKQTRGFLRSNDPSDSFGFDGWYSFGKVSGTGRNAKNIFLKLIDAYPELVFTELKSKKESLDKARNIAATIGQKRRTEGYELPDAIALLYCINVADDLTDRNLEMLSISTFRMAPFSQFMLDPQSKKTLERMIGGWSTRIEDRKLECLMLLVEKDFPQAREVAIRLLESATLESGELVRAMQCLYRFGTPDDVPLVERWLEDNKTFAAQRLGNFQDAEIYSIEHRDVALLVAMHLAGVDYSREYPELKTHPLLGFGLESLLMPPNSDEARNNRVQKWKDKRQADKRDLKPSN